MTDDLIERLRDDDLEAAENVIRAWALLGGGDEGQWPRYIALGIASATDELRARIATQQEAIAELRTELELVKHKAAGHIDCLLLYATGHPSDSHPRDAISFYRTITDRPLRTEGQFGERT